ncbi:MAG: lactate racemase domain-containing protein [Polyangiaceae bacterium]|jgi:nickel-dependent lactate racemase
MIGKGKKGVPLDGSTIRDLCAAETANWDVRGKRLLLVVPDHTRTAPIGAMFRILHRLLAAEARSFDVLIALGTHPAMSDAAIDRRLGMTQSERHGIFSSTRFFNHRWDDPSQLASVGAITENEVADLSGGRMRERVNVTINKAVLEYDLLIILGPTFPHEVVGFSGGNKYLFPGISGREFIDMFHWLGALITNPAIIGAKHTPVRAIIDRAARFVPTERKCMSLVVEGEELVGVYLGSPEEAWNAAADLSEQVHVRYEPRAFRSVLSQAPRMYDDLWTGGKCAYKLEPVVEDDGELIIYAPHIASVSEVHGEVIRRIGYHVRDYFLKQMNRFLGVPRGVMAHSTHVKGVGSYDDGVESPRIRVTLATQIAEAECRALNLGYRDFRTVNVAEWADREDEGLLYVPKAGETLFRLRSEVAGARDATTRGSRVAP